jgi:hypothetical protein
MSSIPTAIRSNSRVRPTRLEQRGLPRLFHDRRTSGQTTLGQFEYLLLLAAVILGLAITDLALSLNRLLGAGARVRWDWLSPLAAIVAFLKIVTQWWSWYGAAPIAKGLTFGMFVGVLVSALLLYLLAAAALPDNVDEPIIDLRAYFASITRRFWLLFAAHWALANAVNQWVEVQIDNSRPVLFSPYYLIVPLAVSLAFVRIRWLQTIFLLAFIAFYMVQSFGHALR